MAAALRTSPSLTTYTTIASTIYAGLVRDEIQPLWAKVPEWLSSISGTNTIVANVDTTIVAAPTSVVSGKIFGFTAAGSNTGAATLNVAGIGATNLRRRDGTALQSGDIVASSTYLAIKVGSEYRLLGNTENLSGTTLKLSGMTAGSVLFAGASGLISQDNLGLFYDDTNNRLGLGITSPAKFVHVFSSVANATDGIKIEVTNGASAQAQLWMTNAATNYLMYLGSTGNLAWWNGTADKMTLTSAGNLGLGGLPQGLFHVIAASNDTALIRGHVTLSDGASIYAVNSANTVTKGMEFGGSKFLFTGGYLGIGVTPLNPLDAVVPTQAYTNATAGVGGFRIATGAGANTAEALIAGVHDGDYAWLQAVKPGTANRILALNPNGGNVAVGAVTASYLLDVAGTARSTAFLITSPSQVLSVAPTGNPTTSLATVSVQGASIASSQREFLVNLGFTTATGSGAVGTARDKCTLYSGMIGNSGGGDIWAGNFLTSIQTGWTGSGHVLEIDMDNQSGTDFSTTGATSLVGISISGASTNMKTAAIQVSENSVPKWNYGILFVNNSIYSYSFYDQTNPIASIKIAGAPTSYAIDLSGAVVSAQIVLRNNCSIVWKSSGGSDLLALTGDSSNRLNVGASFATVFTNASFGVGTSSPLVKLHAVGASASGGGTSIFALSTGTGASTDEKLHFGIHDGDYAWIEALKSGTAFRNLMLNPQSGSVGIGVTTIAANAKFEVAGTILVDGSGTFSTTGSALSLYGGDATAYRIGFDNVGGTRGFIRHNVVASGAGDTWGHVLGYSLSASPNTFVNVLFAGASGNVGIGTTGPLSKLHVLTAGTSAYAGVNRGLLLTDTSGPRLLWENPTGTTGKRLFVSRLESDYWALASMADAGGSYVTDNILTALPSGNVGIGTASPGAAYLLDVGDGTSVRIIRVNGAASGSGCGSAIYLAQGGSTNIALGNYSSIIGGAYDATALVYSGGNLKFWAGGLAGTMTSANFTLPGALTSVSAVVNYGSTTGYAVDVSSAGNGSAGSAGLLKLTLSGASNVQAIQITQANAGGSGASSAALFKISNSGSNPYFNFDDKFLMTQGGSVSIGTTTSAYAFNLYGSNSAGSLFKIENTHASGLSGIDLFNNSNALGGWLYWSNASSCVVFGANSGFATVIQSGGANSMAVLANGHVNIATITDMGATLGVTGNAYVNGSTLRQSSTSGAFCGFEAKSPTAFTTAGVFSTLVNGTGIEVASAGTSMNAVQFTTYNGSAYVSAGSITSTGTTTAFNTSSDERLKMMFDEDKIDWGARIDDLWIGAYKSIADGPKSKWRLGIRAQQAYGIVAQGVMRPANDNDRWGVDYGLSLAPLALWGVKELRPRVAAIENELQVLRSRVAELEARLAA